jgi:O-acetyl-ADP-ribose deacetylase (regulator of RNase III)
MKYQILNTTVELIEGDITLEKTQAIVNAANNALAGGGGVDGAIHRAAGAELMAACRQIGGCPTGSAVITPGFKLPAAYVIHTVGPIFSGVPQDKILLASCYTQCLELARRKDLASIAFPSISTGVYGYPLPQAAPVALTAIAEYIKQYPNAFTCIRMVLFNRAAFEAYQQAAQTIFRLP